MGSVINKPRSTGAGNAIKALVIESFNRWGSRLDELKRRVSVVENADKRRWDFKHGGRYRWLLHSIATYRF
jgi:hypothetical protein